MRKSLIFVVLSVTLMFLVSCSKPKLEFNDTVTDDLSVHIDLTWGAFSGAGLGSDDLYDYISERFNVDIKMVTLDWNERLTQVRTWAMGNKLPDVTFFEMNKNDFMDYIDGDVIRPMPTITEEQYPNLYRQLQSMKPYVEETFVDGKQYAWPRLSGQNKYTDLNLDSFMYVYRRDWAEELESEGKLTFELPDDNTFTIEQVKELAKAFVDNNMGGEDTIGLIDQDFAIPSIIGAYSPNGCPAMITYVKDDNGDYVWGGLLDETIEGIKEFKDWYDQGIYYQEFYAMRGYDNQYKYYASQAGITYDNLPVINFHYLRSGFAQANPELDVYKATTPMYVKGTNDKFWSREMPNYWSYNIYNGRTVTDEKMARILTIQDWIASEEGTLYTWFGIKGRDWEYASEDDTEDTIYIEEFDTTIKLMWEKDSNGNFVSPNYPTMGIRNFNQLASDFDWYNPSIPKDTKEAVKAWQELRTEENTYIVEYNPELTLKRDGVNYLRNDNFFQEYQDKLKQLVAEDDYTKEDVASEFIKAFSNESSIGKKLNRVLNELNE